MVFSTVTMLSNLSYHVIFIWTLLSFQRLCSIRYVTTPHRLFIWQPSIASLLSLHSCLLCLVHTGELKQCMAFWVSLLTTYCLQSWGVLCTHLYVIPFHSCVGLGDGDVPRFLHTSVAWCLRRSLFLAVVNGPAVGTAVQPHTGTVVFIWLCIPEQTQCVIW